MIQTKNYIGVLVMAQEPASGKILPMVISDETIKQGDFHYNVLTKKISNFNLGTQNPNYSNYKKIVIPFDKFNEYTNPNVPKQEYKDNDKIGYQLPTKYIWKYYNSMNDYIVEFCTNFNKDVPAPIKNLWDSIIEYSEASNELGGEGNSGEFHDSREEEKLRKIFKEKQDILVKNFADLTGYRPVWVPGKEELITVLVDKKNNFGGEWYIGAWDFEKVLVHENKEA
jgi:hypothetical protein